MVTPRSMMPSQLGSIAWWICYQKTQGFLSQFPIKEDSIIFSMPHLREIRGKSEKLVVIRKGNNHRQIIGYRLLPIIININNPSNIFSARTTGLNASRDRIYPQLKLGNIREYSPGDIPQFSNFAIYVRAFSFCPAKIAHLDKTEHFKQRRNILNAFRVAQTLNSFQKKVSKIEHPCLKIFEG